MNVNHPLHTRGASLRAPSLLVPSLFVLTLAGYVSAGAAQTGSPVYMPRVESVPLQMLGQNQITTQQQNSQQQYSQQQYIQQQNGQGSGYLDPAYNRYKEPAPANDPAARDPNYNGSARNRGYWYTQDVRVLPTPQAGRMTDSAIHQDYLSYETQQARINASTAANNAYASAKAQCWLDVSFQEYTRNDRSSFVEEAFLESTKITDALGGKTGGQPWTMTHFANGATNKPAPIAALWERWNRLTPEQKSCKPVQTACGEVELVHAGNEWNQGGFVHAKPYIMLADRYISQAELNDCAPPPVAYVPAPPVYVPPPPPPPPVPVYVPPPPPPPVYVPPPPPVVVAPKPIPVPVIPQRVHFPFDQDYIAPGTNQVLDRVASALKSNPGVRLQAVGHTDVRATDRYNLDLSTRRVSNVMNYLRAAGITPGQVQLGSFSSQNAMTAIGAAGESQVDRVGSIEEAHQYNRRVEFGLVPGSSPATLQVQYDDLHPCGNLNNYWCDNPKRKPGEKAPADIQVKMKAEKAQIEALMRKLQSQK